MRVADYLFSRLADAGLRHVFMVTGGGAMFLNEAVRRESRLRWTCHHHEQAAAMAAEGYARVTGVPAILSVTTGPGAINALNGVFGAWTDSIPMIVISGQVKRETCMSSYPGLALRQLGDQETDIVTMARGVTKLALQVTDPVMVRSALEEALWLATHGRQGPVWLDVPIDVQSSDVDPASLAAFVPPAPTADPPLLRARASDSRRSLRGRRAAGGTRGHRSPAGNGTRRPPARGRPARSAGHDGVDARPGGERPPAVVRPSGHHRGPGRQLHRAGLRPVAGHWVATEHPADQLQLGSLRSARLQDPGGCRSGGAGQANGEARHGGRRGREGVPRGARRRARASRVRARAPRGLAWLVQRANAALPGRRPPSPCRAVRP